MSQNVCILHLGLLVLYCSLGNTLFLWYLLLTWNYCLQKVFFEVALKRGLLSASMHKYFSWYTYSSIPQYAFYSGFWKGNADLLFGIWAFWGFLLIFSRPGLVTSIFLVMSYINQPFSPYLVFFPHKYFHHFLAPYSSSFISLKEVWSILVFSKNGVSEWIRAHWTMQSLAQHLSEAGKYPYIVCYIHIYNYMVTGNLE